tara:strand:+ start:2050 stop:2301 length:252 start_codon:yes stop_codon:yes gene_type:complete
MGVWDIVETAPVEITPIGGLKALKAPSVATATLNTFTPQVEQGPHLGRNVLLQRVLSPCTSCDVLITNTYNNNIQFIIERNFQ